VDVSSTSLQASIGRGGAGGSFPNTPAGIAALGAFCHTHQVALVAMEATGGHERQVFALLADLGFPVAVLNPRSVRQFAASMGRLEKTDLIDAGMIAWFAEVKNPAPTCLAPASQQRLRALVTRLRQLTGMRTAQLNQRRLITDSSVQASFEQILTLINRQIKDLSAEVSQLIEADPLWSELDRAFRSIKGVADRTVARLMAEMPEIGSLPNKAISKLAGLAPLAQDSGKHQGRRMVRGGRSSVREILFVVAIIAGRYEPDFIAFRQRLLDAGKPPKVIRIALAHKLLVRLNAKARQIRRQLTPTSAADKALACPSPV
jgi:transposase